MKEERSGLIMTLYIMAMVLAVICFIFTVTNFATLELYVIFLSAGLFSLALGAIFNRKYCHIHETGLTDIK